MEQCGVKSFLMKHEVSGDGRAQGRLRPPPQPEWDSVSPRTSVLCLGTGQPGLAGDEPRTLRLELWLQEASTHLGASAGERSPARSPVLQHTPTLLARSVSRDFSWTAASRSSRTNKAA